MNEAENAIPQTIQDKINAGMTGFVCRSPHVELKNQVDRALFALSQQFQAMSDDDIDKFLSDGRIGTSVLANGGKLDEPFNLVTIYLTAQVTDVPRPEGI